MEEVKKLEEKERLKPEKNKKRLFNQYIISLLHAIFYFLFRPVDLGRLCAQPHPSARDSFPLVTCGFMQRRTKGRPNGRLHSNAQVS